MVGTTIDITDPKKSEERREQALQENARLLDEVRAAAARQRVFMREILEIVTEGRLFLRDSFSELPQPLPQNMTTGGEVISLDRNSLRQLRDGIENAARQLGFPEERWKDVVTAAGEAGMNAVVHGRQGTARIYADHDAGLLQIWVSDRGTGIDVNLLHRATIQPGYSSVGTLGYGFWIMLKTCDRVHLLTGPEGTTVVLEQGIASPIPAWFDKGPLGF
jgi:anti-sigma regulatory factor (Ser/Thr protein kinase)